MIDIENTSRIVCFGDSVTKGYYKKFDSRVRDAYSDYQIEIINAGEVGETSADGVQRIEKIIDLNPEVAIVGFGMNDWRKGVRIEDFRSNIELIVDSFCRCNIRVILMNINPDGHRKGEVSREIIEYNKIIKDVALTKSVQIADIYSSWLKQLPEIKVGLSDDFHPNKIGNEIICEVLMRTVPRSQTVVVWAFNGVHAFCNYKCEYCYVSSDVNVGHHFRGNIDGFHHAFKDTFGNRKIVFYLPFGEPMAGRGFYDVLDMIAEEPNWTGHITSNLSLPLDKLVKMKLVKDGRLNINGSFHPTQVSVDEFLTKLLFLREHGIECPVVFVMYPTFIKDFEGYFEAFNRHHFLVHVRRFRGWYDGRFYPEAYTNDERKYIARYCDDATIKYMLNDSSINLKGKLSYEGMHYVLTDETGNVYPSPDNTDKYLGNVFKGDVKLYTEPQPYRLSWNGSVNGVASLLELNYRELEGNFVVSFAKQGGVYYTPNDIYYKNLNTDFDSLAIMQEYGFPLKRYDNKLFINSVIRKLKRQYSIVVRKYFDRKIYPVLERRVASMIRFIGNLRNK